MLWIILIFLLNLNVQGQQLDRFSDTLTNKFVGARSVSKELTLPSPHQQRVSPKIETIIINETVLIPKSQDPIVEINSCYGRSMLKIGKGEEVLVKTNSPFLLFLSTETAFRYSLEPKESRVEVTYMVQATQKGDKYQVKVPLNLSCSYDSHPYLRMRAQMTVDFYQEDQEKEQAFDFVLVCASAETVTEFQDVYKPAYVFFWVLCNLITQIYHGYPRDRSHVAMFLVFLISSMLVENRLLGYAIMSGLFFIVLLRQKRERAVSRKVCSLYLTFLMIALPLLLFAYTADAAGSQWNSLLKALQNFIQLHIAMFMVLRLIKLSRLRYVFWYFIAVAAFAVLYEGNNNSFFSLDFTNPMDLTCLKAELFFPVMMLPISNYFTSLTNWMHWILGLALALSALLPLNWSIISMALLISLVEAYEIKTKSLQVINHRY